MPTTPSYSIPLAGDISSSDDVLSSPPRYLPNMAEYETSCAHYEKQANVRLRNSDTIVLAGYGCCIKVRYDALCVEYFKGKDATEYALRLDRGTHKIKQLIFTGQGGYITFDALAWCKQQGITVLIMGFDGEIVETLTAKQERNARLCAMQWQVAHEPGSGLALQISNELIRRKTQAQISVLARRHGSEQAVSALENGLAKLDTMTSIDELRLLEGRLASLYWQCFLDIPLKWEKAAWRAIPSHWKAISARNSPLNDTNARHAVNPFHAALNFALAVLQADVMRAVNVAGLEPTIGFLHTYSYYENETKYSLVYDLMEPFRPVVDRHILNFFRETVLKKGDVYQTFKGEARLSEGLRRYILASCRVNSIEIDRLARWLRAALDTGQ